MHISAGTELYECGDAGHSISAASTTDLDFMFWIWENWHDYKRITEDQKCGEILWSGNASEENTKAWASWRKSGFQSRYVYTFW